MNKVLITIFVPLIERQFDVYVPISKRIGYVKILLEEAMLELSDGNFRSTLSALYNKKTGSEYDDNVVVQNSDIHNGSKLILL